MLEIILSESHDALFFSAIFSLFLIGGMFFAIARYSYLTLKGHTLSRQDLFTRRAMSTNDIKLIQITKEGFFGATRITTDKSVIMLNHVFFDRETVNDLIEDLQQVNPEISVKE